MIGYLRGKEKLCLIWQADIGNQKNDWLQELLHFISALGYTKFDRHSLAFFDPFGNDWLFKLSCSSNSITSAVNRILCCVGY